MDLNGFDGRVFGFVRCNFRSNLSQTLAHSHKSSLASQKKNQIRNPHLLCNSTINHDIAPPCVTHPSAWILIQGHCYLTRRFDASSVQCAVRPIAGTRKDKQIIGQPGCWESSKRSWIDIDRLLCQNEGLWMSLVYSISFSRSVSLL